MLFLIGQTGMSLAAGWTYLTLETTGGGLGGAMLALSIVPLPASVLTLAIFTAFTYHSSQRYYATSSFVRRTILVGGGVTHDTLYPRILPISVLPTAIVAIAAAVQPSIANLVILGTAGTLVGMLLLISLVAKYRARRRHRIGAIRLRSSSPGMVSAEGSDVQELRENDLDDWVSSPGMFGPYNITKLMTRTRFMSYF
jgi:hypothetical protein